MALAKRMGAGRNRGLPIYISALLWQDMVLHRLSRTGWNVEPMRCLAELLPHTHAHTGNGADFGLDPITACQAVRMMGDYEEGTRWEQEGIRRGFTAIAPLFSQITNLYRGNGCLRLSEKSIDSN